MWTAVKIRGGGRSRFTTTRTLTSLLLAAAKWTEFDIKRIPPHDAVYSLNPKVVIQCLSLDGEISPVAVIGGAEKPYIKAFKLSEHH